MPTPPRNHNPRQSREPVIDHTVDYPDYVLTTAQREGEWVKPFYTMMLDSLMDDGDDEETADFMLQTEWPQFVAMFKRRVKRAGRTPEQDMALYQQEQQQETQDAAHA